VELGIALVAAGAGVYRIPASARVPHAGVRYVEIADARSPIMLLRRPEPAGAALLAVVDAAVAIGAQHDRPDRTLDDRRISAPTRAD
jgi:hypothetical protein